jgi:hypothetical protein
MTDQAKTPKRGETITAVHCQSCGTTDLESVGYDALREREGYTACCNERAIYPGNDIFNRPARCGDDCYHD